MPNTYGAVQAQVRVTISADDAGRGGMAHGEVDALPCECMRARRARGHIPSSDHISSRPASTVETHIDGGKAHLRRGVLERAACTRVPVRTLCRLHAAEQRIHTARARSAACAREDVLRIVSSKLTERGGTHSVEYPVRMQERKPLERPALDLPRNAARGHHGIATNVHSPTSSASGTGSRRSRRPSYAIFTHRACAGLPTAAAAAPPHTPASSTHRLVDPTAQPRMACRTGVRSRPRRAGGMRCGARAREVGPAQRIAVRDERLEVTSRVVRERRGVKALPERGLWRERRVRGSRQWPRYRSAVFA
ncbi:hypothetical protein GGX14DRAFT_388661 [Mycena pura]|uniref:Uncharacterized protein n=1 Tax=Mycena pura TaxID=153505 RepID=A0AAD6YK76_9AGAR|nr:hypothetical protein GGX14DRAFT_388661 [Mycena pura]